MSHFNLPIFHIFHISEEDWHLVKSYQQRVEEEWHLDKSYQQCHSSSPPVDSS
jgi:hypothetical protein